MAQKRKKQKKWISWLVLTVLFLVASVVVYFVWDGYFRYKNDEDGKIRTEQIEKVNEGEDGNVQEGIIEIIEKPKVEQYEGDDPNGAEVLSGAVTYARVNGDRLIIRINIDQYLDGGRCDLSVRKDGVVLYSEVANVVGGVSTATCEGFDVPVGSLENGTVSIVVDVQSGDRVGTINGEANL